VSIVTSGRVIDAVAFETLHILMNGLHRIRILFRDLQYDHLRLAVSVLLSENTELEVEVGYGREKAGGININLITRMRPTLNITRRDGHIKKRDIRTMYGDCRRTLNDGI
jgi:hypothetical protein